MGVHYPSPSAIHQFIGREPELAELNAGLVEVITRSTGHLFLISGEPGIGKTRLAMQFANDAAARDVRVIWGRCWEGDGAPAYWPWIQVLRTLLAATSDGQESSSSSSEVFSHLLKELKRILPELQLSPFCPSRHRFTRS